MRLFSKAAVSSHRKSIRNKALAHACAMESLEGRQLLSLLVDVRLAGGGKAMDIDSSTGSVTMEVWATVSGSNTVDDEALSIIMGNFVSTNVRGGAALGNLTAVPRSPFNAAGSSRGNAIDLDDDGDLDVGSNDDSSADGFFIIRASEPVFDGTFTDTGKAFRIGTLTFNVDQLLGAGQTRINFAFRGGQNGALWVEDGTVRNGLSGQLLVGKPVILTGPDLDGPTATLTTGAITPGAPNYTFTVDYRDPSGVKRSTIDGNDILVTGPGDVQLAATLVSASPNENATRITATYRIVPPGRSWDAADNGAYTVSLKGRQVSDVNGNFAAAMDLGQFEVNVPSSYLYRGKLFVNGTAGDDTISIVSADGKYTVTVGSNAASFSAKAVKAISIRALAGNDAISIGSRVIGAAIDAGTGDDSVNGGRGNDNILGGGGNDLIRAGSGRDLIDPGTGSDIVNGGSGVDTVTYARRRNAVNVSLDGQANDGESGEADNISIDVENITGGRGNDILTGSAVANVLVGGLGADKLYGGGGNDNLDGGRGRDQLFGQDGNDILTSKDGEVDTLDGGAGSDTARIDGIDRRRNIETVLR